MNHKRGRPKSRRSGCLMCKPHKANGCEHKAKPYMGLSKRGFGKLRDLYATSLDLRESVTL